MFQYTSETIINSNEGALKYKGATGDAAKGVRFAVLQSCGDDAGKIVATGSNAADEDVFVIDGVVSLRNKDIKAIYKTPYLAPEQAKVEITVPTINAKTRVRLRVNLAERGRSSSIIQNARLHKNRPFTYEVEASSAPDVASALVNLINKEMKETDFKFFSASIDSANDTKIVLEAEDCYIRFADARGVIAPLGNNLDMLYKVTVADNVESVEVLAGATAIKVIGSEGAGTVAQLIKDLRIPTSASTDPFHGDHGGMPIPGGKYDQYLIEVETTRRGVQAGIVGALGTSLTSFVFFVESSVSDWDTELAKLDATVKEAGMPAANGVRSGVRPTGETGAAVEVAVNDTTKEATFKKKA